MQKTQHSQSEHEEEKKKQENSPYQISRPMIKYTLQKSATNEKNQENRKENPEIALHIHCHLFVTKASLQFSGIGII